MLLPHDHAVRQPVEAMMSRHATSSALDLEVRGVLRQLIDGGTVVEPLAKAPWGDSFGMAIDRFGTQWLVNISGAPAQS